MGLQHGFSLVEILVALLIVKIGLLGALAGQTLVLQQVQDATQRTLAVALTQGIVNELKANRHLSGLIAGRLSVDAALPEVPVCAAAGSCSNAEIAVVQAHTLLQQLQQSAQLSLLKPQFCLSGAELAARWQQKAMSPGSAIGDCALGKGFSGFSVMNPGH
uniref:Type IV fimbrial biogenesis protein PilV n=1 Tax=Rheinheimera sp. BAL341 TaxID=1708203 RepID=A0A486XLI8_9GAMM